MLGSSLNLKEDLITYLSKPATHSKNPKTPVTRHPQTKTVPSQLPAVILSWRTSSSPVKITKGTNRAAEPTFVHLFSKQYYYYAVEDQKTRAHQASCIVEFSQ